MPGTELEPAFSFPGKTGPFLIVPGYRDVAFISACLDYIGRMPPAKFIDGDSTAHSWRELAAPTWVWPTSAELAAFSTLLDRRILRCRSWFNLFAGGEFIARHKDAGGDAQLLVGITIPVRAVGGQLWIEKSSNMVPVGPGDAVLFRADQLWHGTTRLSREYTGLRVTLNIRFWTE
jgi:hypothetical protein